MPIRHAEAAASLCDGLHENLRRNFNFIRQVMGGGAAAQTLRDSAVRLNHRLRRFAGANALKKIALNVIAKVKKWSSVCRENAKILRERWWDILGRVKRVPTTAVIWQLFFSNIVYAHALAQPLLLHCSWDTSNSGTPTELQCKSNTLASWLASCLTYHALMAVTFCFVRATGRWGCR